MTLCTITESKGQRLIWPSKGQLISKRHFEINWPLTVLMYILCQKQCRRKCVLQYRTVRKKSSRQVRTERNDHKWLKNKEEYLLTCLETTQHAAVQGYWNYEKRHMFFSASCICLQGSIKVSKVHSIKKICLVCLEYTIKKGLKLWPFGLFSDAARLLNLSQ